MHRPDSLLLSILFAGFAGSFSDELFAADWDQFSVLRSGSSIVFPVNGNVYPLGHFTVSIKIGNPPKVFELDIDTGSDITWVQCDAPCTGCTLPPDKLYEPRRDNVVSCQDPLCDAAFPSGQTACKNPNDQCDYEIEYADHGSSLGVLVKDLVPLQFNGRVIRPNLGFGCGYNQHNDGSAPPPLGSIAGVLGLSSSKATIVSQLSGLGFISNVVAHCLSRQGGGVLFFGRGLVPSSKMSWTKILSNSGGKYSAGPAEVYFDGRAVGIGGLIMTFDSGSTYTYFNSQLYGVVEKLLKNDLKKHLKEAKDETLVLCWKGTKPFQSIEDVRKFFKPLALRFTNSKNVQFQIPPEGYLIISRFGNVCLGILNGTREGLENVNLIGDISMLDKLVVYDNEKQQIGWVGANCNKSPKNEAWRAMTGDDLEK